jgi:hypothetical protein
MGLKQVALKFKYRTGLDKPLIVRWCKNHSRYEWYDPLNRVGGVAPTLEDLRNQLDEKFRCSQCGIHHVYEVYVENLDKLFWFTNFIEGEVVF